MGGRDKLLELIDGTPIIARQAKNALAVADNVLVTLPPDRPKRLKVLQHLRDKLNIIEVPGADQGMSASFRAVSQLDIPGPIMVLPCDMPELTKELLDTVWLTYEGNPNSIVRGAAEDGTPGHPVIFPQDLIERFATLTGDEGARAILKQNKDRIVKTPLPGEAALIDLDTPEAWDCWKASNRL
ncbi:molybdopterin-guanine dinucleotide biosynthesis protein A [Actibacterium pelagium]|uniref:Molybdopterin-guanine dinucleotide biosynthesis protein A n=2 Tax=Actibacterium pelagium TaxID=2029103 RepID=A0A917AEF0_9RHOB|nr:molybdopterin-guanine dinucleotide biosynthesis protein A [Actibacterium pelagium]